MSRRTRRLKLQETLENLPKVKKAYFQPPASVHMEYPCVVFSYEDDHKMFADGIPYLVSDRYTATLITKDAFPTETLDAMDAMDYCDFDRHYVADNLHHFSYRIILMERIQNV